jgi:hypothetical protein
VVALLNASKRRRYLESEFEVEAKLSASENISRTTGTIQFSPEY